MGREGDTFYCLQAMGQLEQPIWFHTGDRDVATHILRSKLLSDGKTLSEVTAEIAGRLEIKTRIRRCRIRASKRASELPSES